MSSSPRLPMTTTPGVPSEQAAAAIDVVPDAGLLTGPQLAEVLGVSGEMVRRYGKQGLPIAATRTHLGREIPLYDRETAVAWHRRNAGGRRGGKRAAIRPTVCSSPPGRHARGGHDDDGDPVAVSRRPADRPASAIRPGAPPELVELLARVAERDTPPEHALSFEDVLGVTREESVVLCALHDHVHLHKVGMDRLAALLQARQRDLEIRQRAGELVERADAVRAMADLAAAIDDRVRSMPERVVSAILAACDAEPAAAASVRRVLQDEIESVRAEIRRELFPETDRSAPPRDHDEDRHAA